MKNKLMVKIITILAQHLINIYISSYLRMKWTTDKVCIHEEQAYGKDHHNPRTTPYITRIKYQYLFVQLPYKLQDEVKNWLDSHTHKNIPDLCDAELSDPVLRQHPCHWPAETWRCMHDSTQISDFTYGGTSNLSMKMDTLGLTENVSFLQLSIIWDQKCHP